MRALLRLLLWIAAVIVIIFAMGIWWFVYRPLPKLDGTIRLPGLQGEVTVERDNWGVPHIRANSLEDLAEAQGYVMAQDRLWQMTYCGAWPADSFPRCLDPKRSKLTRTSAH